MSKESAITTVSSKQAYETISKAANQSLSEKVVRGGLWIFSLRVLTRGLGFIRTVVLARLLSPSDFGLFGIALLAISIIETFSQTGIQAALIRKKSSIESYLHTAWTISAIRGVILFLILFFFAPIMANFFGSPQAIAVIRIISISTLLAGFNNIGLLFFQKDLKFKKKFLYELSGVLVDITVAIVLAVILRNVWALVWAGLAANCVRLIMSYFVQSYRPRLKFEKEKFKELFGFGRWIFGSGILVFLVNQGDDIFVGKMLGVSALGFYQMAYLISNLPATEITNVISQVSFPAYSKIQNDLQKLKRAYLQIFKTTMFIAFPIAGAIFILGSNFTAIFLGERWMPMVAAMQILALWGLIRSSGGLIAPLFQAINRPDLATKILVIKLILLVILIYPLTVKWGITGTALAVLINALLTNPFAHYLSIRMLGGGAKDMLKTIIAPAMSTLIMISIIAALRLWLDLTTQIHYFFAVAIIGLISYLVCVSLIDNESTFSRILFLTKQRTSS
jgi:O-antigen/teichoic acid export membrane protein